MNVLSGYGQSTEVLVDTLTITAIGNNENYTIRQEIDFDKIAKFNIDNLTPVLRQHNIFVKHYGISSSATISVLGGNANQFALKWENIPVNNPMLGLSDLSIISPSLFDSYQINIGGSLAENGISGISGSLNLKSDLDNSHSNRNIILNYGSFNNALASISLTETIGKLALNLKLHRHSADNDFEYDITPFVKRTNENAALQNNAINTSLSYDINNHINMSAHFWYQDFSREIPPTVVQNRSEAIQDDILWRNIVKLNLTKEKIQSTLSVAYFDELNAFNDSLTRVFSDNTFQKWHYQWQTKLNLSQSYTLKTLLFYSDIEASSAFYESKRNLKQYFGSLELTQKLANWMIHYGLSSEHQNANHLGFFPSISFEYEKSNFSVVSKMARLGRAATTNELYWRPGGNENLLPETGWGIETSPKISISKYHILESKLFFRSISNWILWSLPENGVFFSANNIAKVHSYGLNFTYKLNWNTESFQNNIVLQYNWTNARNQVSISNPRIEKGSQLFYTPEHQINFQYSLGLGAFNAMTNLNYNSSSIGTLETLDAFYTMDLHLAYKLNLNKLKASLFLNINNVTNREYQIIERRPMPGRYFNTGIQLNF